MGGGRQDTGIAITPSVHITFASFFFRTYYLAPVGIWNYQPYEIFAHPIEDASKSPLRNMSEVFSLPLRPKKKPQIPKKHEKLCFREASLFIGWGREITGG